MKPDNETMAMGRGLRRSEERENRMQVNTVKVGERDMPCSKYLNEGPGLGGLGDSEAHGKILSCRRVHEEGLTLRWYESSPSDAFLWKGV